MKKWVKIEAKQTEYCSISYAAEQQKTWFMYNLTSKVIAEHKQEIVSAENY